MENKETRCKKKIKNNGTVFGLCLVGVAAFSVLLATGQVRQARKEQENLVNEQAALENNLAENENITFIPQVDEALQNALEEPDAGREALDFGYEEDNVPEENALEDEVLVGVDAKLPDDEREAEMVQANAAGETADLEKDEQETYENENEAQEVSAASSDVTAQSAAILPTVSFGEADTLSWPVAGNVVLDYSMDGSIYFPTLQQYKYNPALVIGSDEGAQVLASARGIVESIAVDGETGTTITMSLGNGYKLKYGQLQGLAVAEGDVVNEGDLIGYVSQPTKYYCTEGTNLYFAMTKDEKPVDPILYLE